MNKAAENLIFVIKYEESKRKAELKRKEAKSIIGDSSRSLITKPSKSSLWQFNSFKNKINKKYFKLHTFHLAENKELKIEDEIEKNKNNSNKVEY